MPEKKKRCPNGTRRNKKTNRCNKVKGVNKTKKAPKPQPQPIKKSPPKTRKFCPAKKPLYNPVTNRCVLDTILNRRKISLLKSGSIKGIPEPINVTPPVPKPEPKPIKKCPPNKPLYNPVTNRCLMNTLANMKKLGLEFKQKTEEIKEITKYKAVSAKINLDLKKADLLENFNKVTDNIWEGNIYKILIGLHYVLQRHNNACFLSGTIDTPRKRVEFEKFHVTYSIITQEKLDKYNTYELFKDVEIINKIKYDLTKKQGHKENKTSILEFMTTPKNFNLKKQISECKKNNKRFVIGLIFLGNMVADKPNGHENSYIYDIKTQELEIFEPHGAIGDHIKETFSTQRFYSEFLEYFEKNEIPVKRFYKPIDYCPRGPQYSDSESSHLIKNAPGGYCAAWSIYYLDARLSNPNIPRDLLITTMNINFRDRSAVFINSYSTFIVTHFLTNVLNFSKLKKKYPAFLKNFNINKLTKSQQKYLNEQLIKEIINLVYSM